MLPHSILSNVDPAERLRLGGMFGVIALMHLVGWGVLFLVTPDNPALLGTGVLAYSLGLRHAFDADHIAAIDNTTRAALQEVADTSASVFSFRSVIPRSSQR